MMRSSECTPTIGLIDAPRKLKAEPLLAGSDD
jgi:hypothetical protein